MATNFSCLDPNLSHENITEEAWSLDESDRDSKGQLVLSSFLFIVAVIGIALNASVMVALSYHKFWKTRSLFLLFNLVLVDFLSSAMIIPFMAIPGLAGGVYNYGSNDYERCQSCQAGVVIVVWLIFTSMHIIALMSLDRLVYIKKPLQYEKWITVPRLAVALVILWIFCLILSIPPLFGFGYIGFSRNVGTCATLFEVQTQVGPGYLYIGFLVAEVTIPLGVLVVCNIWLLCFVHKGIKDRFKNTYEEKGTSTISEVNKKAKKKYIAQQIRMVKVFGSIFASNFVTWIPVVIVLIVIGATELSPAAFSIVFLSFLIQSVVHPLIESTLSARVRKLAKKVFCCFKHNKKERNMTKVSTLDNETHKNQEKLEMSIKN